MKQILYLCALLFSTTINAQCFQSVSVGAEHTLAIKTDGTLWAWGSNDNGEAGLNTIERPIYTPRKIGNDNDWENTFCRT